MNFEFNEEQMMLKDSIIKWSQDNYSFDQRRVSADNPEGFSRAHWATFAELGWLSVPFAEEYGGYGGSIIDLAAIMQEFGKMLATEPLVPTMVLFGGVLSASSNEDIKTELIPQIIDGSLLGAVAIYEPQSRFDMSNITTSASVEGDGYLLNGSKSVVLGGAVADKILVLARTSGEQNDEVGVSLFVIDGNADGVSRNAFELMDGQQACDVVLQNTPATLVSELDQAYGPLMDAMQSISVALAAEATGIMERLNLTTVEYTKTRKQFGVPISSFQALQHRMVDTFMAYEQVKSLLVGTLCELTDDKSSPERASKLVSALRTLVAKNGKLIGDEAIQLHGGMGLTDELDVGHYVKRLMMINLMFGNADFYQQQFNEVAYG
ncbi:MAG: acyl-CoA dehydrogenase family protein [Gammaproteobacteria bacterium]|nr:acyl-CoA dehydrogenase family protein [Gammaproteobacteria bacterium]